MSTDRLREAARVLRERAETVTARDYPGRAIDIFVDYYKIRSTFRDALARDAAYIATVHPGVGLTLADWLDSEADRLAGHLPAWEEGIKRYPESWVGRTVEDNVRHHYDHALTVADLILGGAR